MSVTPMHSFISDSWLALFANQDTTNYVQIGIGLATGAAVVADTNGATTHPRVATQAGAAGYVEQQILAAAMATAIAGFAVVNNIQELTFPAVTFNFNAAVTGVTRICVYGYTAAPTLTQGAVPTGGQLLFVDNLASGALNFGAGDTYTYTLKVAMGWGTPSSGTIAT